MAHNIQSTSLTSSGSSPISSERASTLITLMSSFYTTSDNPTAHDEYANFFMKSATLIMGGKRADGFDDILAFRKSIWTSVLSRKHVVAKIFFGQDNDMMLYGTVTYVMKHDPEGKDVKIDWAARAEFEDGLEGPRMRYYQVYLDTAAQQAAAAAVQKS
ncbi:hypothetical protein TMatcc_004070 [Talaromyces marneffei ATCC 18224]|uniref:SnoaL-like domain-containing protein n=2 Tax=Talaromyces marneffei TaxID=37727 RepID=B6Q6K7_TALMQ|nr:uncharacterized protein EYB26_000952 [Talaromyces marneffei]EEA27633.1 conserved hypothetical protein [Talaromyces marneffei ATCC 18224]KAE8556681.1 hypothetical protein EYB25_001384 [Talaromyces marneffei]QGA13304.1 hypothetical protein EYB26_000952 [Talaromyces marneffei]